MEIALLIEWDPETGERAGGINPRDPNLPCYGWQDLESRPAREIRLVKDGRDLKQYENVPGIKILRGKDEINRAIDELNLERYVIDCEPLFILHVLQRRIRLDDYRGKTSREILKDLYEKGIVGIRKISPRKL